MLKGQVLQLKNNNEGNRQMFLRVFLHFKQQCASAHMDLLWQKRKTIELQLLSKNNQSSYFILIILRTVLFQKGYVHVHGNNRFPRIIISTNIFQVMMLDDIKFKARLQCNMFLCKLDR